MSNDIRVRAIATLESDGFCVTEWHDEPNVTYAAHVHARAEVRIVVEGTMSIIVAGDERRLGPGDRIDLAADVPHSARVGPNGVHYIAGTRR